LLHDTEVCYQVWRQFRIENLITLSSLYISDYFNENEMNWPRSTKWGHREDTQHLASLLITAGIYYIITGLAGLLRAEGNNEAAIEQERPCTCNEYLARVCNLCGCGKPICITYSACVFVVLIIQHAKRVRRIILSSVACLYHILTHYLVIGTIFGKTLLNVKCASCFSL
jgi:hypothetical protein